jgi:hypothetical protein
MKQAAIFSGKNNTSTEGDQYSNVKPDKFLQIIMTLKNSPKNPKPCFSKAMIVKLQSQSVEDLMEKISNYSFVVTTMCMILVYAILGQIRKVTENE